ncbi:DUF4190 domain-containing protein [Mycetocola tolaasinivorans]|uniref:DUF4190 domain-containing protein n=1 Tax=Mycetocola tolaasinivorans TaxID=76635 RepID=A0A3L7A8N2_9MICO|nr:DUF4190 domain-containing protein [Mycetocola tolaasinivorans]RLP75941.1 DUF4190 domain-containing protein [Mycetocola tolaasinivorans]
MSNFDAPPPPEQPPYSQPQYAQSPQYPQNGQYPPSQNAPAPVAKGIAITALIIGIVALLLSFLPVVGIMVGAIAVIVGIVALVMRQPKRFGLTGLILGAVAVIINVLVTVLFSLLAGSFVKEYDRLQSPATALPAPDATSENGTENRVEATGAPVALGTSIVGTDYTVVINSFTPNQTAEVLAADEENFEPEAGNAYAVVNYTVTYTGSAQGTPLQVGVRYVTAAGEILEMEDTFAIAPEPMLPLIDVMEPGASVSGNIALEIPAAADGTLLVNAGGNHEGSLVAIR